MTQHDYDYDLLRQQECTTIAADVFNLKLDVDSFICDDIETGDNSYAVLFKSCGDVYALLVNNSEKPQTLADVQEILKNMGITVMAVLPPHGDKNYFYRQAMLKLEETYPAYRNLSMNEIYLKYVEYNPALVRIAEIKDGVIRRFNKIDRSWQELLIHLPRENEVVYG